MFLNNFISICFYFFILANVFSENIDNTNYLENKFCKTSKFKYSISPDSHEFIISVRVFDFDNFPSFDLKCLNSKYYVYSLNFIPNKKLVLDKSFEFKIPDTKQINGIKLKFTKIKAFDISSNLFKNLKNITEIYSIEFHYSEFNIIFNNSISCFTNDDKGFFQNVSKISFGFSVRYSRFTCPFIFSNSRFDLIQYYGLSDTFLKRNQLGFLSVNKPLYNQVNHIYFNSYKVDLDNHLLSHQLFGESIYLYLYGSYKLIKQGLLKEFKNLVYIELFIENFREFFYNNFKILGEFITKRNDFTRMIQLKVTENYHFPDEDFCIFKDFYTSNSTYVFLSTSSIQCTNILKMFNRNNLYNERVLNFSKSFKIILSFRTCNFDSNIEKNEFDLKLLNCQEPKSVKKSKMNFTDILYLTEIINLITIFFLPIFSLLTVTTNLFNLKIIFNLEKNQNCASIKLMLISSIINLVYSIIICIHLVNKCVYVNGIFCSAILREKAVQLFDIIFVEFLLSVLKIWSNVSLIGISWLRLIILIKDKSWVKPLVKFQKEKKFKILIAFLLGISVVISMDKLFVVRINENFFVMDERDYEEFPNKNSFISVLYRDVSKSRENGVIFSGTISYIFYFLYFVNFILNDLLVYLIMLLIDVIMLYFLKQNIQSKKNLKKSFKIDREKRAQLNEVESKISSTVIVNLILIFALKLLDFSVSFYIFLKKLLSNKQDQLNICFYYSRICSNILDFTELFYLFSNAYIIVLFYKLNKNFRLSFKSIFFRKKNLAN